MHLNLRTNARSPSGKASESQGTPGGDRSAETVGAEVHKLQTPNPTNLRGFREALRVQGSSV